MVLWIGSPESRRLGRKRIALSIAVSILGIILKSLTATFLGFALVFLELLLVWESDVRFQDVTYTIKKDCVTIDDGGVTTIMYDRILEVDVEKGNTVLLRTEAGCYRLYHIKDCERVINIIKEKMN